MSDDWRVDEYRRALRSSCSIGSHPHIGGVPALIYLAREGVEDLALRLLSASPADEVQQAVRLRDACGMTALHYSAHAGLDRLVARLLRYRADPHATSLDVANSERLEDQREPQACEVQVAEGALCAAGCLRIWGARAQPGRRQAVTSTVGGRTALHFAAAAGNEGCVALLLRRSPEIVLVRDWHGVSAFQLACRHGHGASTRLLQRAAASQGEEPNELVPWPRRLHAGAATAEREGLRERQRRRLQIVERPLLHEPYTLESLWPPTQCADLIHAAEALGRRRGWSTGRHRWHSTVVSVLTESAPRSHRDLAAISPRSHRDLTEIALRYHRDITDISPRYHRD